MWTRHLPSQWLTGQLTRESLVLFVYCCLRASYVNMALKSLRNQREKRGAMNKNNLTRVLLTVSVERYSDYIRSKSRKFMEQTLKSNSDDHMPPPKKADYKIILSTVSKTEMIMHAGVWNATLKTANFVDSSTKKISLKTYLRY